MLNLHPFRGWRYDPGKIGYADVIAPPWHEFDRRDELYRRHPRNVSRILRGRDFDNDSEYNNRYTRAAGHLDAWRAEELFLNDNPALYVYEQKQGNIVWRGLIGAMLLHDPDDAPAISCDAGGTDPEVAQLLRSLRGNLFPACGSVEDSGGEFASGLKGVAAYEPATDMMWDDGRRHRLWVIDNPETVLELRQSGAGKEPAVTADTGVYRAAYSYRNEVRERLKLSGQKPPELGSLPCDYLMSMLAPVDPKAKIPHPPITIPSGMVFNFFW